MRKNFKYAANMHSCMMHIGLIILASIVQEELRGIAEGRTDCPTDGRRKVTHNSLFFLLKSLNTFPKK